MRIENTSAQSNYDDLHSRYLSALATITRPKRRSPAHRPTLSSPGRADGRRSELAATSAERQHSTRAARRPGCRLARPGDQKQQEVDQLSNKIDNLKQSARAGAKQLNIMNSMEEGVVSQVDKLKAQRDAHDLKSELEITHCSCRRQSLPNRKPRTGSGNRN